MMFVEGRGVPGEVNSTAEITGGHQMKGRGFRCYKMFIIRIKCNLISHCTIGALRSTIHSAASRTTMHFVSENDLNLILLGGTADSGVTTNLSAQNEITLFYTEG
jgi:hypothetical protein